MGHKGTVHQRLHRVRSLLLVCTCFLNDFQHQTTNNCLNLAERLSVRSQEYMDILTVIYSRLLGIEMLSLSNEDGDTQILRQLISDVDTIIQVSSHYLVHYNDVTYSISDQASECSQHSLMFDISADY